MKKLHIILIVLVAVSIASCKKTLDNLLTNPNYPTATSADVDLYTNQVELSFNGFYQNVSDYGAQLSRQQNWGGPLYQNAYTPPSFDGLWTTAYSSVINNADALIPLADAQKKYIQAGIAYTLKAYTLGTLVDVFNDVPDSQSELGTKNPNPKVDPAATVYKHVQALLDSAIIEFAKPGAAAITSDLFYGGGTTSAGNWTAFANSLKLKFYMQTRLVDPSVKTQIQALITGGKLITTTAQDFQFQYGTNNSTPDTRHPHYAADYVASGGEGEYISNYFIWQVGASKYGGANTSILNDTVSKARVVNGDPRLRYYFYRQVDNLANFNAGTAPCIVEDVPAWYTGYPTQYPFCVVGTKGYYGRDHGDNSAAPPDASYRTAWGIYPAGGQFDADQPKYANTSDGSVITTLSMGGKGAGISPIWLSSYTLFLEAEAVQELGVTSPLGTAADLLTAGVKASVQKVIAFPSTISVTVPDNFATTDDEVANYVALVNKNYAAASGDKDKLNIVMTEYFIAAYGNGIEAYNNLRRTGMPLNQQPAATTQNPGIFMYSFLYPSVYVERNLNHAPQKNPGKAANHVFWDNNPDNFVQ